MAYCLHSLCQVAQCPSSVSSKGMWNTNNIRRRVLEHINQRLTEAQAEYQEGADREDATLADGIKALTDANKRNKQVLEEVIVRKIIG